VERLVVDGRALELRRIPGLAERPWLVFLHEGLGSAAQWRDFPDRIAAAARCPALIYSRHGHGQSEPLAGPRGPDYMHHEALVVLPALLGRLGIERPLLVGHSDGASIALIHAGGAGRAVAGLVLMAPHVFVEPISIQGIAAAGEVFRATDLAQRLGRYHRDPVATFRGWNDIWLSPAFRDWNIERFLPAIAAPALLIQGREDEYGSLAQLDAIERGLGGPVERLVLADCRHAPQRDQPAATEAAILRFLQRLRG
jgi:pimeloyl-ACP methyl ester carboxylesterase